MTTKPGLTVWGRVKIPPWSDGVPLVSSGKMKASNPPVELGRKCVSGVAWAVTANMTPSSARTKLWHLFVAPEFCRGGWLEVNDIRRKVRPVYSVGQRPHGCQRRRYIRRVAASVEG